MRFVTPLLVLLGILAGLLTTVAGLGGGMLLLLALSLLGEPAWALAVSAPALLLGNVHRAYLFRRHLDLPLARSFALGAFPGALAGGLLVAAIPPLAIQLLLVGMTALSVLRAASGTRLQIAPRWFGPLGLGIGALTGAGGGAALLAAPLFLSAGLSGARYVATVSTGSAVMHTARIIGYGAGGLIDAHTLLSSAVLAGAIFAGNAAGERIARGRAERSSALLEHAMLVSCVVLSLLGLAR